MSADRSTRRRSPSRRESAASGLARRKDIRRKARRRKRPGKFSPSSWKSVQRHDGDSAVRWRMLLLPAASLLGQAFRPADPAALLPLYEQALAAREAELGLEHPKVARSASDLGLFLKMHGDPKGAESALRQALTIDMKALGERDALVAEDRENLGLLLEGAH